MAENTEADVAEGGEDLPLTMGGYADLPPDMFQFIQMFGSGKRTAGQGTQVTAQPNLLRGADPQNEDERFIFLSKFHTVTCNTYRKGKMCPFDKRCLFAHGANEMRRNPLLTACQYGPELCPMVRDGKNCEHGMICPFSRNLTESLYHPERYKSKVCQKWLSGYCHREGACAFIHDPRYFGVNSNGNGRTSRRQNGKSSASGATASAPTPTSKGTNPALSDQTAQSETPHRHITQSSRGNSQPNVPEVTMIFSSARPQTMDFLRQHADSALVPLPGGINCLLQEPTTPEKEFCFQELNKAIAMAIGNQGGSILLGFHPHHLNDAYIRQQASLNHRQFMGLSKVISSALQMFFVSAGIKSCKVIIHELSDSASSHGPTVVAEVVIETFSSRFSRHHQSQSHPKSSAAAPYPAQSSSSFSIASNPFPNMLFAPQSAGLFHGASSENSSFGRPNAQQFAVPSRNALLGSKELGSGVHTLHEKARPMHPSEQTMVWSNTGTPAFPGDGRYSMESAGLEESMQHMHLGLYSRGSTQNPGVVAVPTTLDSVLYSAEDVSMWNAFPDTGRALPNDPQTLGSSW